jgi:hypothetical protein
MRAEDISKTAFTTLYGNFEFRAIRFGLCGAPSTFQHMMHAVFAHPAELSDGTTISFLEFLAPYLDDICVFSDTEANHITHRLVLARLRSYKLHVNLPNVNGWKIMCTS